MTAASRDVLLCGAFDEGPGYPRTTSLRAGLVANGITVRECRAAGLGRRKHRLLRSPWQWPRAMWQMRRQRQDLVQQLRHEVKARRPACVVVPYPGHGVVHAVKAATDVPVVLDLFLSAYDTIVEDRQLVAPGSLAAWWLQRLDTKACAAADLVLVDTPTNAAYVAELTGLPAERFAWLPVHDPNPATPTAWPESQPGTLRLLFFGTGVPLHGLPTLVDAVAMVPGVVLTLVGGTKDERDYAHQLLRGRLELEPEFVPIERLHALLQRTQLVAGVFGDGGKAQRVVPFKVVHALAAGRPVVTADTPAINQWLDGSGALFTARSADPLALAALLRDLAARPERVRAAAAHARPAYDRHFGTERLAARWAKVLAALPQREGCA